MKFSIEDFFSKWDQIRKNLRIWSHLLKKSLMEDFIFCVVLIQQQRSGIFQGNITAKVDIGSNQTTKGLFDKNNQQLISIFTIISLSSVVRISPLQMFGTGPFFARFIFFSFTIAPKYKLYSGLINYSNYCCC